MTVLDLIANKLSLVLLFKHFVADTGNKFQMFNIKKINDLKILFSKLTLTDKSSNTTLNVTKRQDLKFKN